MLTPTTSLTASPVASRRPSSAQVSLPKRTEPATPQPPVMLDNERYHHNKSDIWYTVGMLTFGAFTAFVALLLVDRDKGMEGSRTTS